MTSLLRPRRRWLSEVLGTSLALVALASTSTACTSSDDKPATTTPASVTAPPSTERSTPSPTRAPTPSPSTSAVKGTVSLHPGAAVLAGDVTRVPPADVVPSPAAAPHDIADYQKYGCQVAQPSTTVKVCAFGVTEHASRTVAVVGDSVAAEWLPALEQIAAARKWKIITMLHSRCPFSATMTVNSGTTVPYTSCHDWGRAALAQLITTIKPAVVITSDRPSIGTTRYNAHTPQALADIGAGMATYWRTLIAHKIAVVAIEESPETGIDQPACLMDSGGDPRPCTVPKAQAVISDAPSVVAARRVPAAFLVNMNSLICGPRSCSPIVGNVLVYRDEHHLTETYVRTTAPYLDAKLQRVPALR